MHLSHICREFKEMYWCCWRAPGNAVIKSRTRVNGAINGIITRSSRRTAFTVHAYIQSCLVPEHPWECFCVWESHCSVNHNQLWHFLLWEQDPESFMTPSDAALWGNSLHNSKQGSYVLSSFELSHFTAHVTFLNQTYLDAYRFNFRLSPYDMELKLLVKL